MKHSVFVVLEYVFLGFFLVGPLLRIIEQLAVADNRYSLTSLGVIGLYMCGIGTIGLIITLLIDEWYYPDPHKPKVE